MKSHTTIGMTFGQHEGNRVDGPSKSFHTGTPIQLKCGSRGQILA
jgi:hypothetical protein